MWEERRKEEAGGGERVKLSNSEEEGEQPTRLRPADLTYLFDADLICGSFLEKKGNWKCFPFCLTQSIMYFFSLLTIILTLNHDGIFPHH